MSKAFCIYEDHIFFLQKSFDNIKHSNKNYNWIFSVTWQAVSKVHVGKKSYVKSNKIKKERKKTR